MTDSIDNMAEAGQTEESLDMIQDTLDTFLATADVDAVYGEPIENGDTLVIPTAEILSVLGFGFGSGYGKDDQTGEKDGGGGGGGGGKILSRPVAVVIASPEGVRVEPVVDVTKVALAALTAAGFMFSMLLRMMGERNSKESDRNCCQ